MENNLKELERMGVQAWINEKKQELQSYDYIGVKIAMGVATREEYAEQITHTEQLRREINELESEVEGNAGIF